MYNKKNLHMSQKKLNILCPKRMSSKFISANCVPNYNVSLRNYYVRFFLCALGLIMGCIQLINCEWKTNYNFLQFTNNFRISNRVGQFAYFTRISSEGEQLPSTRFFNNSYVWPLIILQKHTAPAKFRLGW